VTIAERTLSDGETWHGEGAVRLAAGKAGATCWRFELLSAAVAAATAAGVSTIDRNHLQLARSFLGTNRDVLLTIALPGSIPLVLAGVRQGLMQGLIGVVVAEYFIGATGVGGLIFWGLILYYLTRTHVKAFFGKGGLQITPAYVMPYSPGPQINQSQTAATNAAYGRPSAVDPPLTFPPLSQGSSTSLASMSPGSLIPSSSNPVNSKSPVCPYCHTTLPMGTRKCLTCGAAI